jgi:hypothetical protein
VLAGITKVYSARRAAQLRIVEEDARAERNAKRQPKPRPRKERHVVQEQPVS